ncbi:hypothetical protein P886_1271 [Alteromonadaceae bacterium 2753L.S.0a.02]|nr:hypothetical protein P886_1271 [Alteromonadaceae bacterium 2753L.S.0a.02]
MKKIKYILCWAIIIFPCLAYAGWENAGKVTRVHSGHGNGPYAFSTEININVDGCTQNNVGYFVSETNSASERIYSLLLAAYMSGKPIAIYTTGECISSRPEVNAVQIKETSYF